MISLNFFKSALLLKTIFTGNLKNISFFKGMALLFCAVLFISPVDAIASIKVGDTVSFGNFYINSNTQKEAVLFRVLDEKDGKLLILSENVLDCQPFNKNSESSVWESSFIRKYLNEDFLKSCFSDKEASLIVDTEVVNSDNPEFGTHGGQNTVDKVFLLSVDEVEKYFNDSTPCAKPTLYARSNGAYYFDYAYNERGLYNFNGNTTWWLRTPGKLGTYGARVNLFGAIFFGEDDMVFSHNVGVRPAMWVDGAALENSITLKDPEIIAKAFIKTPESETTAKQVPANAMKAMYDSRSSNTSSQEPSTDKALEKEPSLMLPEKVKAGDIITFGSYYQEDLKKKTPIEWKVLDVDGDTALIISERSLDCQDYNRWEFISNWSQSTIRDWLNEDFLNAAFTSQEQKRIEFTHVINYDIEADTAAGENTDDRVFLLSIKQAMNYFKDDDSRVSKPTMYARTRMASFVRDYYSEGDKYENCGYWLLRSPDSAKERADYVDYSGALCDGVFTESLYYADINISIRPAMWINLKQDAQIPEDLVIASPSQKEPSLLCKDVKAGDKVYFGSYYINSKDTKEPVLWQVLESDGQKALLITDYGVDNHCYHTEDTEITYENSSVRAFLNNELFENMFDESQKAAVIETEISNTPNVEYGNNTPAGNDTKDKLFLLSIDEARYLFADNMSRRMGVTPYCKSLMSDSPAKNYGWWLRSPGESMDTASTVVFDGYVRFSGHKVNFFTNTYVIRPAVYVDLNKLSSDEKKSN